MKHLCCHKPYKGERSLALLWWWFVPSEHCRGGYPRFTGRSLLAKGAQDEAGLAKRIARSVSIFDSQPEPLPPPSPPPPLPVCLGNGLCAVTHFCGLLLNALLETQMLLPLGAGGRHLHITGSCLILCFACPKKQFANTATKLLNHTVVFKVCFWLDFFFISFWVFVLFLWWWINSGLGRKIQSSD